MFGVEICFCDVGYILGLVIVEIFIEYGVYYWKLVFFGDLGNF